MIHEADILAAIRKRWLRERTLADLVPGGLHFQTANTERFPYARFWLEPGQPNWTSGKAYWQEFTLQLGVFTAGGPVDSADVARVVDRLFDRDRSQDFLLLGGRVLDLEPVPGMLELDETTREAKDVLVLSRRWNITVQGER